MSIDNNTPAVQIPHDDPSSTAWRIIKQLHVPGIRFWLKFHLSPEWSPSTTDAVSLMESYENRELCDLPEPVLPETGLTQQAEQNYCDLVARCISAMKASGKHFVIISKVGNRPVQFHHSDPSFESAWTTLAKQVSDQVLGLGWQWTDL